MLCWVCPGILLRFTKLFRTVLSLPEYKHIACLLKCLSLQTEFDLALAHLFLTHTELLEWLKAAILIDKMAL
jgi:hypothetical protein